MCFTILTFLYPTKSVYIQLKLHRVLSIQIYFKNEIISQKEYVEHLKNTVDKILTWASTLQHKTQILNAQQERLNPLINFNSKHPFHQELVLYKMITRYSYNNYEANSRAYVRHSNIRICQDDAHKKILATNSAW